MKLKYYMRGLGIGIILTTLILAIANPKEKLSDDEIKIRAGELGMVAQEEDKLDEVLASISPSVSPTGEPVVTVSPTNTPTITPTPAITQELSATPIPTPEPTVIPKPTATVAPTATIAPTPTAKPVPSTNKENKEGDQSSDKNITFSVKRGMSSGQVANVLVEKGLIDDAEKFNNYIVKAGKASIIRVGTYTLPRNSTYDEIINKITK